MNPTGSGRALTRGDEGIWKRDGNTEPAASSKRKAAGFALCTFLTVLGCSGVEEEPGALGGRFVENIARFDDGKSQVTCTLFRGAGRSDRRDLVFKKAPDLLSNTEIEVWGTETAGRIEVPGESRSNGAAWVAALAALGAVLARRRRAVGTA